MAKRSRKISSDPQYLLEMLDELSEESDDGFDGYISDSSADYAEYDSQEENVTCKLVKTIYHYDKTK